MKTPVPIASLFLAGALGLAGAGQAAEFKTVETSKSSLSFGYRQMGVALDGHFGKFSAQLSFDPARASAAQVAFDVDLASIDTGSDEGNDAVSGKEWFDTRRYPTARFVSTQIKPLPGQRYEVAGQLTIKGRTQAVSAPTTVTVNGATAAFDGAFVLKRADFAVGEGAWADFGTVANEVQIKFHVLASASSK